jgi:hypothetical protein
MAMQINLQGKGKKIIYRFSWISLNTGLIKKIFKIKALWIEQFQIFWDVVGLERGPLSLGRITEELLERKVAAPI